MFAEKVLLSQEIVFHVLKGADFKLEPCLQDEINSYYDFHSTRALSIKEEMHRLSTEQKLILFYNEEDPFTEWMGNFYPATVEYNGLQFSNSEAAFQAQKFIRYPDLMPQFTSLSGDQAFHKARDLSSLIRPDWLERRVQVMKEVIQAKIEKNPYIIEWLDATGEALLVEHNPVKGRDTFWSDDFDGTGFNMLGKLWMEIRAELRGEPVKF